MVTIQGKGSKKFIAYNINSSIFYKNKKVMTITIITLHLCTGLVDTYIMFNSFLAGNHGKTYLQYTICVFCRNVGNIN